MTGAEPAGHVASVHMSGTHSFSKPALERIVLLEGLGVEGDAHLGKRVKHRYLVKKDPDQPNLRQVHLIHGELLDGLSDAGFDVPPGALGENITTRGLDLLGLPRGTRLEIGADAVVEVTGLRNPCHQIDKYKKGLLKQVLEKDKDGNLVRKSGIMGIVASGGAVRAGDPVRVVLPDGPHEALVVV